jgi:hypothetical protein
VRGRSKEAGCRNNQSLSGLLGVGVCSSAAATTGTRPFWSGTRRRGEVSAGEPGSTLATGPSGILCNEINIMRRTLIAFTVLALAALSLAAVAFAQSGHFVGTPTCTDEGTTVKCTGKVAGLGGTTFEITVSAPGTASVECTNPGGNVAPGQSFSTTVAGTSGPLATPRNGQFRFTVESDTPSAPPGSCPNPMWTAEVVDVEFGDATITLTEDGVVSDTITVRVS